MSDITLASPTTPRGAWALAILLLLVFGLTFATDETMRIKRSDVVLTSDNGIVLTADNGDILVADYRVCQLVIGSYTVPLSWSCK